MAVLREKRQFKVGTIGVARSSRGGAILGEAIAESANALNQQFYERAAQNAQERGIKSVEQYSPEEITTLGEDGLPTVLKPPKGFGRIASKAREQALLNRFESEIELELTDKAKEFANKFRRNPEGYKKALSDYTAEMINVEGSSVFKRFIRQRGESLTSDGYRRLVAEAQNRHDRDMSIHNLFQNQQAALGIQNALGVGNIKLALQIEQEIQEKNDIDVAAGYILSGERLGRTIEREQAKAKGTLEFFFRNTDLTRKDLQELNIAITTNDPSYISNEKFLNVRELLENSSDNATISATIKEFALPLIQAADNREIFENTISTLQLQQEELNNAEIIRLSREAANNSAASIDESIEKLFQDNQSTNNTAIDELRENLSPELFKAQIKRFEDRAENFADSFGNAIVSGHANSLDDINRLQVYLANPDDENAFTNLQRGNSKLAQYAQLFVKLDKGLPQFGFLGKLSDKATSFKDEQNFFQSKRELKNSIDIARDIKSLDFSNEEDRTKLQNSINETELDDAQRNSLQNDFDFRFGKSKLSSVYNNIKSEAQLASIDHYAINGVERDSYKETYTLTDDEKKAIDEARTLLGDNSTRVEASAFGNRTSTALAYEKEIAAKKKFFVDILSGPYDNTKENRDQANDIFNDIAVKLGASDLRDFIINSNFDLNGEEEQKLLVMLRQSSVLPTDVLAVFDGLANQGGFVTGNFSPSRVLNIYDAVKNKINLKQGQIFDNAGLDKILDPDTAATLDLLLAEYRRMPPMSIQATDAAISNKMKQISAVSNEPAFQKELLSKLEKNSIEEYVLENFSSEIGIDTDLLIMASSVVRSHYAQSKTDPENVTFKPKDALTNFFDARLKKDDLVKEVLTEKTLHSLDLTTRGNRDLFISYIENELASNVIEYNEFGEPIAEEIQFDMFGGKSKVVNKIDWKSEEFYLVPLGKDTQTKGQVYSVVNKDGEAYQRFVDDGEGNKVPTAVYIGTREQPFLELVRKQELALTTEAIEEAQKAETIDVVSDKYPAGSPERQIEINKFGNSIVDVFAKLEENNPDLFQDFDDDDKIYFKNKSFNNESVMADMLYKVQKRIKEITDEKTSALDVSEITDLGIAVNNALTFINNLKDPDGN
tara:strand:+ start:3507 stop:6863 length:3357 start_codon:yes stop_codon:yes gene_type:complete